MTCWSGTTPAADWRPLLRSRRRRADQRAVLVQRGRPVDAGGRRWARTPAGWSASTWPPARPRCWPRTRRPTWTGVRLHPDTNEPQIVTFRKDRTEYRVLDPDVAADLTAIRALHPGDPALLDADDADAPG